jgi:uncharacterized protein (DUF433 family)
LPFIKQLFSKLDFDTHGIAQRYWPKGRDGHILVDPKRKMGQPVIEGTNIEPSVIYTLYKGGEDIESIGNLYEIDEDAVRDAIAFCEAA